MTSQLPLILCLDYGQAKIGLAIGSMQPATPLQVIHYSNQQHLLQQLIQIIDVEKPEQLLFGWPADTLQHTTPATDTISQFAQQLSQQTGLPHAFHPETLTTKQALQAMIAAGIPQKRRRLLEDSFAAAAILNDYLEQYG